MQNGIRSRVMANLVHQVCQAWSLLRHQKWPVFRDGRGITYSMHQFRNFFNGARVPGLDEDTNETFFKTKEEGICPKNVVVLYKGRFFSFEPFGADEKVASSKRIEMALSEIENYDEESELSFGPLSCMNRTEWSGHYQELKKNNPDFIRKITGAICLVILSDLEPQSSQELLNWTYVNDGSDIWTDKNLTFVAFKNGAIGSQSEVRVQIDVKLNVIYFCCVCGVICLRLTEAVGATFIRELFLFTAQSF